MPLPVSPLEGRSHALPLPAGTCDVHPRHVHPAGNQALWAGMTDDDRVQEEAAAQRSALTALHTYRKVLGVIGICHGPECADMGAAYQQFEAACRPYSDAITQRCFVFEPSDAHVKEDKSSKPHLMMFPPTESGARFTAAPMLMQHLMQAAA